MPTAEYKPCPRCGEQFLRPPRRSQAQWDKTRFCSQRCARSWNNTTHGATRTPSHHSWMAMRSRCLNPNAAHYQDYGGRGITICPRWDDFAVFLADMGTRPPGSSLDRIDNGGNYEPGNCRWATAKEQAANRRPPRRKQATQ